MSATANFFIQLMINHDLKCQSIVLYLIIQFTVQFLVENLAKKSLQFMNKSKVQPWFECSHESRVLSKCMNFCLSSLLRETQLTVFLCEASIKSTDKKSVIFSCFRYSLRRVLKIWFQRLMKATCILSLQVKTETWKEKILLVSVDFFRACI